MPTPVYIICSESAVDDKTTGLVSYFNVLEKIHFFKDAQAQLPLKRLLSFRVTAVWMRQPSDGNTEFEWDFLIGLPASKQIQKTASGTFSFSINPETPLWRCGVNYEGPPPIDGSGTLILEHRIRPKGGTDWITQSYPLVVEEINASTAIGLMAAPQ